jgi:hypothetical protein
LDHLLTKKVVETFNVVFTQIVLLFMKKDKDA